MNPASVIVSILATAGALGVGLLHSQVSRPAGRIDGLVRDEARRPLREVVIVIESTPAGAPIADIAPVTNEQGRFSLPNLPPGRYTLRVSLKGYQTQRQAVEVEDGKSTPVEFVMPRAAR
jgi:hypothetical protein